MHNSLHSQTLSAPLGKWDDIPTQILAIRRSADPTLWVKFLRLREERGIHMDEVVRLTDRSLQCIVSAASPKKVGFRFAVMCHSQ